MTGQQACPRTAIAESAHFQEPGIAKYSATLGRERSLE